MAFTLAQSRPHAVYLEWAEDTSTVIKYWAIFRSTSSGGTYSQIGTAVNIYTTARSVQLPALVPPQTSYNFFTDDHSAYPSSVGVTYYYKYAPVDSTGTIGTLSTASSGVASAALPVAAVVPSLPVSQNVPAPKSRLWLEWVIAGSSTTVSDHLMNFATRPGTNWAAWTTDVSTSDKFGAAIAAFPTINHIIYEPWGKKAYANGAGTYALEYPLGSEVPTSEGGANVIGTGRYANTQGTDSNTFLEACYYRAANTNFDKVIADFATAFAAVTAQGIHVSVYVSPHFLNTNVATDAEILADPMLLNLMAANVGVMFDSIGAIDYKMDPQTTGSGTNPNFRAVQLLLDRGIPVWIEPLSWRDDVAHWINGTVDVGCISLGSRTVYARGQPASELVREDEYRGNGHISIMGLGSTYWSPTLTTYNELFDAMMSELQAGRQVCMIDAASFFTQFSPAQQAALVAAAESGLEWVQDSDSLNWTLDGSGSERTVLVFNRDWPQNYELEIGIADREDFVAVYLPGSGDGLNGYRIGIDPIDSTKISITQVDNGIVSANLTSGANDTPPSDIFTVAHGYDAGEPFRLRVRTYNGTTEVRLDDDDTPIIVWTTAGQGTYGSLRRFGFESDVAGALVLRPRLYELIERAPSTQAEVLVAVCAGRVFYSINGNGIEQINDPLLFKTSGLVSLTDYDGVVYGTDGKNRLAIDLAATPPTIDSWDASAGNFPGTESPYTGDTEMSFVASYLGRVAISGAVSDPQNFFLTAVGTPDDFDTAADEPGQAFASGTGLPNKIGEPITCLYPMTRDVLLIGCLRSVWRMVGDPALGIPEITPVIRGVGITGQNAVTMVSEGLAITHGPDGVLLVDAGGSAVELSKPVLSAGIQLPRTQPRDFYVSLARDPLNHLVYIFLTPKDQSQGTHFVYDERVGGFKPGDGGFFPDDLPATLGPTCAVSYQGRVLMGTWDGRIVAYSDDASDDAGTAIDSRFSLSLLADADLGRDTILNLLRVCPATTSDDFTVTVYGGRTAEEAFGDDRWSLFTVGVDAGDPAKAIRRRVRAAAMVLELSATSGQFAVEEVQIDRTTGALITRRRRVSPATVAASSGPPEADVSPVMNPEAGEEIDPPALPPQLESPGAVQADIGQSQQTAAPSLIGGRSGHGGLGDSGGSALNFHAMPSVGGPGGGIGGGTVGT